VKEVRDAAGRKSGRGLCLRLLERSAFERAPLGHGRGS
jgi:hypothetical protein